MSENPTKKSLAITTKTVTFNCEWHTSTYNTKSDMLTTDGRTSWCVGVKYNPRLSRYVLYLISTGNSQFGTDLVDVFFKTTHASTARLQMNLMANYESTKIFSYELIEWKTPVICNFWVSVAETCDKYCYQLTDRLMADQMWSAATNCLFTDIQFDVDGRIFNAHKVIVAARSPVLAAMFQNDMAEARSNKVRIEDMEADVFENLLYFLYTGKLTLSSDSRELYAAADKYQVDTLKLLCQEISHEMDASSITSLVMSVLLDQRTI